MSPTIFSVDIKRSTASEKLGAETESLANFDEIIDHMLKLRHIVTGIVRQCAPSLEQVPKFGLRFLGAHAEIELIVGRLGEYRRIV